jgi:hypothetical protein
MGVHVVDGLRKRLVLVSSKRRKDGSSSASWKRPNNVHHYRAGLASGCALLLTTTSPLPSSSSTPHALFLLLIYCTDPLSPHSLLPEALYRVGASLTRSVDLQQHSRISTRTSSQRLWTFPAGEIQCPATQRKRRLVSPWRNELYRDGAR